MAMCLILDCPPIAVRPTPVAHRRAALAPRQPQGPMRQRIWPPARPVAVLQAAMAQRSQTVHQAPHHVQDGPVRRVLRKLSAKIPSGPLSPSLADSSLDVRQILRDQAGHALTCSQYQKQTNRAKQRATVLKRVAQLDINQLPLPEPEEPLPGPSGESNGASRCVKGKQRDSTATSSDEEEPPPPRRKKSHGPKRH